MTLTRQDRVRGMILGLACGDALGAPVEGYLRGTIQRLYPQGFSEMLGGGELEWAPGQTTDDTAMVVCLARSLLARGGYEPQDALARYVDWWHTNPPGIGGTLDSVLEGVAHGASAAAAAKAYHERSFGLSAGNGSLMRCAPLAAALGHDPEAMEAAARADSALTHYDPLAAECCVHYLTWALILLEGRTPPLRPYTEEQIKRMASKEPALCSTGLEVALYSLSFATAEQGIVWAVNLGGDTDTNAALAGALLGARDGYQALPARWLDKLAQAAQLIELADQLAEMGSTG